MVEDRAGEVHPAEAAERGGDRTAVGDDEHRPAVPDPAGPPARGAQSLPVGVRAPDTGASTRTFKSGCGLVTDVDRERLERELEEVFGGDEETLRAISRQARDLADSGRIDDDFGHELTVGTVVENLQDAPADHDLVERWNWWVGSLDLSKGGYQRFHVRPDVV